MLIHIHILSYLYSCKARSTRTMKIGVIIMQYKETLEKTEEFVCLFVCLVVFNASFNNISVTSWRSVLLVEETGGPGKNL